MSEHKIASLSAAVDASPGNVHLRLQLADALLSCGRSDEALKHIGAAVINEPGASTSSTARLISHPDFHKYVKMASRTDVRGAAAAAARALLGLPPDEPIKTGPRGKQVWATNGRTIENVASTLKRHAAAGEPKPTRLAVTLSGSDVVGATIPITPEHDLYDALMALFDGRSGSEASPARPAVNTGSTT